MSYRSQICLALALVVAAAIGVGIRSHPTPIAGPSRAIDRPLVQLAQSAPATSWRDERRDPGEETIIASRATVNRIAYLTALDLIAAHVVAGRAAYLSGDRESGAEMFAHAIAELYVDFRPALAALGAHDFLADLQGVVDAAVAGEPPRAIDDRTSRILAETEQARSKAPPVVAGAPAEDVAIFQDLVLRAAVEYDASFTIGAEKDCYLDGFGFYQLAKARSASAMTALRSRNSRAAAGAEQVMYLLDGAYASIEKPLSPRVAPGAVLAAASRAGSAVIIQ